MVSLHESEKVTVVKKGYFTDVKKRPKKVNVVGKRNG
jgi:hypothetical protein